MQPTSAQNKGKRFAKFCDHQIEEMGLGRTCPTPGSGSGKLKGDSFNNLPFLLEYKNEKGVPKFWLKNVDQAMRQAEIGNWSRSKWALITRDPRLPEFKGVYATIDFWEFLTLLKRNQEPKVKAPDREMKWKVQTLVNAAKRVIKELED